MKEVLEEIFKAIVVGIVVVFGGLACLAGLGAWGGFALAAAAGAGKGLALAAGAAGLVAAPALAIGGFKLRRGFQQRQREKRYEEERAAYRPQPVKAPAPAAPALAPAAPAPAAPKGDDTPPVFTDAMAKLEQLDPEERKKYLGKLRDRFPNEVETLHDANDKMALQHDIKLAKPMVFAAKPGSAS